MESNDSIVTYVDYGSIDSYIKDLMKEKNITKTQLIKKGKFNNKTVEAYIKNNISSFDLDVLARLCFVLECDISDFLNYHLNDK